MWFWKVCLEIHFNGSSCALFDYFGLKGQLQEAAFVRSVRIDVLFANCKEESTQML